MLAFELGASVYYVPPDEATILRRLLHEHGAANATALIHSMDAVRQSALPPPIRLGPDDVAALRDALCPDLFMGFPALTSLQIAVCQGQPNYVFRDR